MKNNKQALTNFIDKSTEIGLAQKSEVMVQRKGTVFKANKCILKNILHVPDFSKKLLSVFSITENNGEVKFLGRKVENV